MITKEKERSRKYKTRIQIINDLPNDKQELKVLAAKLMVINAALEEEPKISENIGQHLRTVATKKQRQK